MFILEIYINERDKLRENLLKYTRKTYNLIPEIKNPNILDVGCGTGVPTIELAKISNGHVTGIDIDEKLLNILRRRIKEIGLNNKISVLNKSINMMDFQYESFDIIWSEGAVFVIGFENSIKNWRKILKPNGFLVLHDDIKDKSKKLGLIEKYGYKLVVEYDLSFEIWWNEYYSKLEKFVEKYKDKFPEDSQLRKEIESDRNQVNMCKSTPEVVSSFYAILKKELNDL
jgi:ubiquinone/menaquinone biosynthesis C-methylase UbiE